MFDKKQIWAIFLFEFKMGCKVVETTCNINIRRQSRPVVERGLCGLGGLVLPRFLSLWSPRVSPLAGWAVCLFSIGFSALCPSLLSFLDFLSFLYFYCFGYKNKRRLTVMIMLTEWFKPVVDLKTKGLEKKMIKLSAFKWDCGSLPLKVLLNGCDFCP